MGLQQATCTHTTVRRGWEFFLALGLSSAWLMIQNRAKTFSTQCLHSDSGQDISNHNNASSIPVEEDVVQGNISLPAHFFCLCPTRTSKCNSEYCDTILTFQDANHTLNIPQSTWTSARNAMYYLAKQQQQMAQLTGASLPSHFCFMDGDTKVNVPKETVIQQLMLESELRKIVAFNYRRVFTGVRYLWLADANLNCFASKTMDLYLPYSTLLDDQAWYLAQTDLKTRANLIEPFVFKMYDTIIVRNPAHNNEYPRDGQAGIEYLQKQYLGQGFSKGCLPDQNSKPRENYTCSLQGKELFQYHFNQTHRHR